MKAKIFVGKENTGKTQTARIISEFIGRDKTVWIFDPRMQNGVALDKIPFVFRNVHDKTELIIFDDCPANFDYSVFYDVKYLDELVFKIKVERPYYPMDIIAVRKMIFITEKLPAKWCARKAFNELFDVINF